MQEKLVLARIGPDYLIIIGLFALVLLDFILVWRLRGDGGTRRWVGENEGLRIAVPEGFRVSPFFQSRSESWTDSSGQDGAGSVQSSRGAGPVDATEAWCLGSPSGIQAGSSQARGLRLLSIPSDKGITGLSAYEFRRDQMGNKCNCASLFIHDCLPSLPDHLKF